MDITALLSIVFSVAAFSFSLWVWHSDWRRRRSKYYLEQIAAYYIEEQIAVEEIARLRKQLGEEPSNERTIQRELRAKAEDDERNKLHTRPEMTSRDAYRDM